MSPPGGSLASAILRGPREVGLKDPKESGFGEHKEVSDHFEGGSMFLLGKGPDQVIALE